MSPPPGPADWDALAELTELGSGLEERSELGMEKKLACFDDTFVALTRRQVTAANFCRGDEPPNHFAARAAYEFGLFAGDVSTPLKLRRVEQIESASFVQTRRNSKMKMGKVLAVSAASGIMLGVLAGCGGSTPPAATDPAAAGAKASCSANGAAPAGSAAPASTDGTKASCSSKGSCSGKAGTPPAN